MRKPNENEKCVRCGKILKEHLQGYIGCQFLPKDCIDMSEWDYERYKRYMQQKGQICEDGSNI